MDYKYLAQREYHWHKRLLFHHSVVLIVMMLLPLLLIEFFAYKDSDAITQELQLPARHYIVQKEVLPVEDNWLTIDIKPGDSLAKIFTELHIPAKELQEIVKLEHTDVLSHLKPHQQVRL